METPRTLGSLIAQYERIDFDGDADLAGKLQALPGVESVSPVAEGGYRVELADEPAMPSALGLLVGAGITSIRTSRPSLEEVYVHVMGDRGLKV